MARLPRKAAQKLSKEQNGGHIKWEKSTDERIAMRLAKNWKEWEAGNKTQFCCTLATELGITLDPKGLRTKNHIMMML